MEKAATRHAQKVVRPAPAHDRVHVTRLAGIALLCFALGLGAVVWNAGGERIAWPVSVQPPTQRDRAPLVLSAELGATPPPTLDGGLADRSAPSFVVAQGDAGADVMREAQGIDAGVAMRSATPFSGARRLEPGRVAYLRCDGVPQRSGPYPCPRDEALETAVWSVLATLPRCADAPTGLGESDVRLELVAGAPPDLMLRAPRPEVPRLDGPALLRCVAGPLSHVATTTRATRLVLSFRFTLVEASTPRAH